MTLNKFVLALATMTMACAYYNGLYNANRLASEARRAESEGRRGDARSLWLQAAVRAESVAARYPDSKYWDDALLMSGRAHRRVGECALAMPPLAAVVGSSADASMVSEAQVLLAECQLAVGLFEDVVVTTTPLADDTTTRDARRARVVRGQAELALGNYGRAIDNLSPPVDQLTRFDLATALLANNQHTLAAEQMRIVANGPYDAARWPGLIGQLAVADPGGASAFVDRWVADDDLTRTERVELLMDDAARWTYRGEHDIAADRLAEAAGLTEDEAVRRSIELRLAVVRLRLSNDMVELARQLPAFRELEGLTVYDGIPARSYQNVLERTVAAIDASTSKDLRLFRVAEVFRDSLGEGGVATLVFRHVINQHPSSAVVPKAMLALAQIEPGLTDSILGVLTRDYPDSPYTDLATGGVGAGFTALEDSIQTVLKNLALDSLGST